MLYDVLNRFATTSGMDAVQQRDKCLAIINESGRELYNELEASVLYRECAAVVMPNNIVALPPFIGTILGVREHNSEFNIPLQSRIPRYQDVLTRYKYNNWRDAGESPVHTLPDVVDALTFESAVVESAIVSVNGKTTTAAKTVETLTLDTTPKATVSLFYPELNSITSQSVRTADITVKMNGEEVAILYNDQTTTRYKLIDVSEFAWLGDTEDGETLVDILYRAPYRVLTADGDIYIAGEAYEEALFCRAMSHFYRRLGNRQQDAANFRTLSLVATKNVKETTEKGVEKFVSFGTNKYYDTVECYDNFPNNGH